MFSSASFSSISFATVTPSLVIVRAEFLVEDDVASLRPEGDPHRVSQAIDPAENPLPRGIATQSVLPFRVSYRSAVGSGRSPLGDPLGSGSKYGPLVTVCVSFTRDQ
jgi:hypothetical protein